MPIRHEDDKVIVEYGHGDICHGYFPGISPEGKAYHCLGFVQMETPVGIGEYCSEEESHKIEPENTLKNCGAFLAFDNRDSLQVLIDNLTAMRDDFFGDLPNSESPKKEDDHVQASGCEQG